MFSLSNLHLKYHNENVCTYRPRLFHEISLLSINAVNSNGGNRRYISSLTRVELVTTLSIAAKMSFSASHGPIISTGFRLLLLSSVFPELLLPVLRDGDPDGQHGLNKRLHEVVRVCLVLTSMVASSWSPPQHIYKSIIYLSVTILICLIY